MTHLEPLPFALHRWNQSRNFWYTTFIPVAAQLLWRPYFWVQGVQRPYWSHYFRIFIRHLETNEDANKHSAIKLLLVRSWRCCQDAWCAHSSAPFRNSTGRPASLKVSMWRLASIWTTTGTSNSSKYQTQISSKWRQPQRKSIWVLTLLL